jgi:photosystem II stability/assembly factor-like uncharacterized protein
MKKIIALLTFFLIIYAGPAVVHPAQARKTAEVGDYLVYLPLLSKPIPPTWLGPDGGKIVSMAIDPIHPDTLYAGTWGAGVFKTTNGGGQWYPVNTGLDYAYIWSLAVNPLQPDIIYAGTDRGKLYKSTNGGASWFLSSNGIQDKAIVYDIVIDPVNPNRVYISTRGISNNGGPPWNGVVYLSSDGGVNWQVSLKNVPGPWQQDWAYSLAIHPTSPNIIFAATHEYGIYRSDDYGYNWYSVNGGLVDFSTRDLVIDPRYSPFTAYAGFWHADGAEINPSNVLKSTDGGFNWLPTNTSIRGVKVYRMSIDRNRADTLYLATQSSQGILKSANGGGEWLPSGLQGLITWDILINPQNSQILYSGTDADGMYRSSDAGASWSHAQKGLTNISATSLVTLPGNENTLYASTLGKGVYKTSDYGDIWNAYNVGLVDLSIFILVQHPTNPDLVYALTNASGLFSTDISLSNGWTASNAGLPITTAPVSAFEETHPFAQAPIPDEEVLGAIVNPEMNIASTAYQPLLCMSFAPSNPNTVYLGTASAGIYKSSNGASSWTYTGLTGKSIWSIAVDPTNANKVYAAINVPGGVKVSQDGGGSWQDLPVGTLEVYALAFSSSTPPSLYAGTSQGLYQWVSGSGWIYRGLADRKVTALTARSTSPQVVYVGTDKGAYTYDEATGIWVNGPTELAGLTIKAINFDLNNRIKGYFSTNTQGILLAQIR